MASQTNRLTVASIRAAKPGDRLPDGNGLRLEVKQPGRGYWRLKYRFGGKEKLLALGVFPEVGIADARRARDLARARLRDGFDPGAERKNRKAAAKRSARSAFGEVAGEWLAFKRKSWAPATYRKAEYVLRAYLLPALRNHSIGELATKDVTKVLAKMADRAPKLALKARQYLGGIVDFAIKEGLRDDGRFLSLRGTVPASEKGHIPAATTLPAVRELVTAIRAYDAPITRAALLLTMYTAMRPGVVASAKWVEFDLEGGEWHVPGARMKTKHAHISPLPRQAIELLMDLRLMTGTSEYVFPSPAQQVTPHLSRDAMSSALRNMGFQGKHAPHGFRGMFRTLARERGGIDVDVLEAQLAHAKRGEVAKAYDRTKLDDARRKAVQQFADMIDALVEPTP